MATPEQNEMLYELSQTRGWSEIIRPMLIKDTAFMSRLVFGQPRSKENGTLDFIIPDMGAYRYAHGMSVMATKILDKVTIASEKYKKEGEQK